jgi:hypothetical protein
VIREPRATTPRPQKERRNNASEKQKKAEGKVNSQHHDSHQTCSSFLFNFNNIMD